LNDCFFIWLWSFKDPRNPRDGCGRSRQTRIENRRSLTMIPTYYLCQSRDPLIDHIYWALVERGCLLTCKIARPLLRETCYQPQQPWKAPILDTEVQAHTWKDLSSHYNVSSPHHILLFSSLLWSFSSRYVLVRYNWCSGVIRVGILV